MLQLSLTKYALRSLVQAYLHCRHSAVLLQRYTIYSRNSWHCDKIAAISSENRRSFSTRNNFPGPFYAALLASGVAQNRFQEHNPVSTYMNSAYDQLKFLRSSLVVGINWIINAKSTAIRQRSFAFYEPIVCHWTGSNKRWKLIWTVMNNTLGVSAIQKPYIQMWPFSLKCYLAGYKKLLVLFSAAC